MGKIYDFTSKKQMKEAQKLNEIISDKEHYASYRGMIQETIDLLVLTYNDKIEEIKSYKEEVKQLDDTVYNLLNEKIQRLEVTIDTLKNTK